MGSSFLKIIGNSLSKITILFIIFFGGYSGFKHWNYGENWRALVYMDGNGYYSYLPATFVYHDYQFSFYKTKSAIAPDPGYFIVDYKGRKVNKYLIGEALALTPFFLAAHGISHFTEVEASGYNKTCFFGVLIAALFYLGLGLFCLRNILKNIGVSEFFTALTILAFGLGSNLFYYTVYESGMSHVYSFSFITLFLFLMQRYVIGKQQKNLFWALAVLCLVVLIRPVNGIILIFTPFFFKGFQEFKAEFLFLLRSLPKKIHLYAFSFSPILLQLIVWYIETRHFLVDSYPGEGFNFTQPEIFNSLFSYNKGLFVYMPICFVSLTGFIGLIANKQFFKTIIAFLSLFLIVYFLSAWYEWRYGWCFSIRPYVDFYSIFALLLGTFFLSFRHILLRGIFILMCCFTIYLNQFQTAQYLHKVIHPYDMNKERFWLAFLNDDPKLQWAFFEKPPVPIERKSQTEEFVNDFENKDLWKGPGSLIEGFAHSGKTASRVNAKEIYSPAFISDLQRVPLNGTVNVMVEGYCFIRGSTNAHLAFMLTNDKGENVNYTGQSLKDKKAETWDQFTYQHSFTYTGKEYLKLFVTGTEGEIYIDDIKVKLQY